MRKSKDFDDQANDEAIIRFCAECGTKAKSHFIFCAKCGANIVDANPGAKKSTDSVEEVESSTPSKSEKEKDSFDDQEKSKVAESASHITKIEGKVSRGQTAKETIFCSECGATNDADVTFCDQCGESIWMPEDDNEILATEQLGQDATIDFDTKNEVIDSPSDDNAVNQKAEIRPDDYADTTNDDEDDNDGGYLSQTSAVSPLHILLCLLLIAVIAVGGYYFLGKGLGEPASADGQVNTKLDSGELDSEDIALSPKLVGKYTGRFSDQLVTLSSPDGQGQDIGQLAVEMAYNNKITQNSCYARLMTVSSTDSDNSQKIADFSQTPINGKTSCGMNVPGTISISSEAMAADAIIDSVTLQWKHPTTGEMLMQGKLEREK